MPNKSHTHTRRRQRPTRRTTNRCRTTRHRKPMGARKKTFKHGGRSNFHSRHPKKLIRPNHRRAGYGNVNRHHYEDQEFVPMVNDSTSTKVCVVAIGSMLVFPPLAIVALPVLAVTSHNMNKKYELLERNLAWRKEYAKKHPELPSSISGAPSLSPPISMNLFEGYVIGFGWDSAVPTDADLVAFVFDHEGKEIARVTGTEGSTKFGNAITHSGDCNTGGADARKSPFGNNEEIFFRFENIPEEVAQIVVGVIYEDESEVVVSRGRYLSGLPVLKFIDSEEEKTEIKKKMEAPETPNTPKVHTIERGGSKMKFKLTVLPPELEEPPVESESPPVESESPPVDPKDTAGRFIYDLDFPNDTNAFIFGSFTNTSGSWRLSPIQVPIEAKDLDHFSAKMSQWSQVVDTISVFGGASKPVKVKLGGALEKDYTLDVVRVDRWNHMKTEEFPRNRQVVCSYIDYLVINWKGAPVDFYYSIRQGDDKIVDCNVEPPPENKRMVLAELSSTRPYLEGVSLPASDDLFVELINETIPEGENLEEFIRALCGIQEPATAIQFSVVKGVELHAKNKKDLPDPYVFLHTECAANMKDIRSPPIEKNVNPEWNYNVNIDPRLLSDGPLQIQIWDKCFFSDVALGSCPFDINQVALPYENTLFLDNTETGLVHVKAEMCKAEKLDMKSTKKLDTKPKKS